MVIIDTMTFRKRPLIFNNQEYNHDGLARRSVDHSQPRFMVQSGIFLFKSRFLRGI